MDFASRLVLLVLFLIVTTRAVLLLRSVRRPSRRISVQVTLPASVVWIVFEIDVLIYTPILTGPLTREVWLSRVALFLTGLALLVQQQMIADAEAAEQKAAGDD